MTRETHHRRRARNPIDREAAIANIASGLVETSQVDDKRYPLERVEGTGQSVPGRRPGRTTAGNESSLVTAFARNQKTTTEKLKVWRKVVRNGQENYEET